MFFFSDSENLITCSPHDILMAAGPFYREKYAGLHRKKGHIAVTYADNLFLPFARLAARTFLPLGVLILALKP